MLIFILFVISNRPALNPLLLLQLWYRIILCTGADQQKYKQKKKKKSFYVSKINATLSISLEICLLSVAAFAFTDATNVDVNIRMTVSMMRQMLHEQKKITEAKTEKIIYSVDTLKWICL